MKILSILSILALAGFSAVLLTPAETWAAACPSGCDAPVSVNCDCGGFGLTEGVHYCWNNQYFSDKASCQAAMGTTVGSPSSQKAPTVVTSAQGLIDLITRIGDWIFAILLGVAAVFLIVAGFLWITAAGNPENVTKARQMLINSLIGIVVALLARGMVAVMRNIIG